MNAAVLDDFSTLTRAQVAARLGGSAAERATFVRAAAEAGVVEAMAVLGQILLDGNGTEADPTAALLWFERAARRGHVLSINMVGRCFDLGWGAPVDKAAAAKWFEAAALRGLDWGMYNYATALALGAGVAEDKAAALTWLRRAAAMRNAKALNFVGSFYEDGWVVERDLAAAATCYAQAAEWGDFRACFNHARMLVDAGKIKRARYWLDRAAVLGNPRFRAQAAAWLRTRPEAALRDVASMFEL